MCSWLYKKPRTRRGVCRNLKTQSPIPRERAKCFVWTQKREGEVLSMHGSLAEEVGLAAKELALARTILADIIAQEEPRLCGA